MTRKEKLDAMDTIVSELRQVARTMEADLDKLLVAGQAPLKIEVDIRLVITDNRQDPRIDSNPDGVPKDG